MRRGRTSKHTVDVMPDSGHPAVGYVVKWLNHEHAVKGYLRVVALHAVRVRVSRGEEARYRMECARLSEVPERHDYVMWDYPPKHRALTKHRSRRGS